MPLPLRPSDSDRPEPSLAAPGPRPLAAPAPIARAAAARSQDAPAPALRLAGERPQTGFTAGDRLTVSSVIAGGEEKPGRRLPKLRLFLLLVLLAFAGIGAATVYHAVAGALPY